MPSTTATHKFDHWTGTGAARVVHCKCGWKTDPFSDADADFQLVNHINIQIHAEENAEDNAPIPFDERLSDLHVNEVIIYPDEEGVPQSAQLNGHLLNGDTAWILIDINPRPAIRIHKDVS